MLQRHPGEVGKWLGKLLGPSDTESFNHLVGFAVYFCSNNMLMYEPSGFKQRFSEWFINGASSSQRNPFLTKALSLQACLDNLLQDPWCTENTLQSLVNAYELHSMSGRHQRQIMLTAVRLGAVRVVESSLANGVDPNFPMSDGHWPCTFLGAATKLQIVKMLLEAGADVNVQYGSSPKTTAVHEAVRRGSLEIAQVLLDAGAHFDPNLKVGCGTSFLFIAVERNDVGMVKFLLERRAILTNHEVGCFLSEGRCSMGDCHLAQFNHSELQYAARKGLTEIVSAITETATGKLALQTGICRWAPLRDAAKAGHSDIVKLLIAAGADVNASFSLSELADKDVLSHVWESRIGPRPAVVGFSSFPSTALAAAIEGNHIEIIRILLSKSVLINAPVISEYGTNALEIATRLGSSEICLLLRDNGACACPARLGRSHHIFEIALALKRGDSEKVKRLFFERVDLPHILDFISESSQKYGKCKIVQDTAVKIILPLFLELREGDINQRSPASNRSALEIALAFDQVELARRLISRGCEVNMRHYDNKSLTALQIAVLKGNFDMAQLLLNSSAHVNTGDGSEFGTALQLAVERSGRRRDGHESTDLIRLLLARGAHVNAHNRYISVLQSAIKSENCLEVIQLLVERGADINARAGMFSIPATALQSSIYHLNLALIHYLLKNGADVNAAPSYIHGFTALQGAAINGYLNIARLLLEHGADPNAAGSKYDGRTALEGAAEMGRLDMVQLLLNAGAQPSKSAVKLAERRKFWVIADMIKKEIMANADEGAEWNSDSEPESESD
jgi:ankyrin repeat protein